MRTLILLTLLAVAGCARASYPLNEIEFDTADAAARAAFSHATELTRKYEAGGLILRSLRTGKFHFTVPFTEGKPTEISIAKSGHYGGFLLVGDYHTHTCQADPEDAEQFSPEDTAGNQAYGDIGWMLDLCSGLVHKYDPLLDSTNLEGFSPGRILHGVRIQ